MPCCQKSAKLAAALLVFQPLTIGMSTAPFKGRASASALGRRLLLEQAGVAWACTLMPAAAAAGAVGSLDQAVALQIPRKKRSSGEAVALQSPKKERSRYPRTLTIPLTDCGGSYCATFRVDGVPHRAVIDTGSPFLAVAGSCTKLWGCYNGEGQPAGLAGTWETYDGREGAVDWRRGALSIGSEELSDSVVFGVLSDSLVGRPGGVFLGLVKREAAGIRPTFLSQTPFQAFSVDLRADPKLVLSTVPLVPADAKYLPMFDLRPFGSPVEHYATRVSGLRVNGRKLRLPDGKPIFAIFDTGTTGMSMSTALWDAAMASYLGGVRRGSGEPRWPGVFDVDLRTGDRSPPVTMSVDRPFPTTPIRKIPWKRFDGHLIVLGLSFLQRRALTVDVDKRRMWLGYDA